MSLPLVTEAPGKLFLLGEYAVLEGGPAVLVPVQQRASVELHQTKGKVTSITDSTVTLDWPSAREEFPLLKAVQAGLSTDALDGHQLTLDTSGFFQKGQKLGLGSSAALTVALVKACCPDETPEEIYQLANSCHQKFQDGIGSGADIALSAMNHPVVFSRKQGPSVIDLPEDLYLLAIWTGQPASTTRLVGSMQTYRDQSPNAYRQHMDNLKSTATDCIRAISQQDNYGILAGIEQYDRQLYQLSSDSGVNFYNELHEIMRKKVKLTYKPSGAGGGDFGIAYSTDKQEIINLAERLAQDQIYAFVPGQKLYG